jgi:hypothetical protein
MYCNLVRIAVLILLWAHTILAQDWVYINRWEKPTSGYWEEPYWTFGLPSPGYDHVVFDSPGWKALAIGASTVRDYPQSLRLGSLIVASPTNSFNTLMLNYAGLQTALEPRLLTIDTNSVFLTLASALRGVEHFWIRGTVNHGALSEVSATNIYIGGYDPSVYNLSNGVLTVSNLQIAGSGVGTAFNQE